MSKIKNLLSAASGMLSRDPLRRIEGLELILSYLMHKLPPETMTRHLHSAPRLSLAHMPDARLFPVRQDMLVLLPRGGRVAEVGTWRGDFSKRIAAVCSPDEFHLFDIDFGPLDEAGIAAAFDGSLHKHLGDSADNLRKMAPNYFDWLYIDGLHTYEQVTRDLAAAHVVLKPGGNLMCNDYTNWDCSSAQPYGVAKAVNELVLAFNYEVVGLALEPSGFHDLLIRKPA